MRSPSRGSVSVRAETREAANHSGDRRSLSISSMIALVLKVGGAALSYAFLVSLAGAMTADEYGRFGFGFSLAMVAAVVASLGLHTAVLRFLSQYSSQAEAPLAREFLRWASRTTLASALFVATVMATIGLALEWAGRDGFVVMSAAALTVPLTLAEFGANALRPSGALLRALGPRDILWRLLLVVSGVVLAGTTRSAVFMLGLAAVLLLAVSSIQVPKLLRLGLADPPGCALDRSPWVGAARIMWASAVIFALAKNVDILIVGVFRPAAETGGYFAATRSAQALSLLLGAANVVVAPLISKLHFRGDTAALRSLLRTVVVTTSVVSFGLYALLIGFSDRLLALFNVELANGRAVLAVLATASLIHVLAGPTGHLLQMVGLEARYLRLMVVVYAISFLVQLVAVPIFGLLGAAVPSVVAAVGWNVWARHIAIRELDVDPTILCLLRRPSKAGL